MEQALSRSIGIFNPDNSRTVQIVGCGSIGSHTAVTVAKMGIKNLHLYDGDIVSIENIGPQVFAPDDIGKEKVEALKEYLYKYTPIESVTTHPEYITDSSTMKSRITVVGVDNMYTRKLIYEKLQGYCPLLVDGRIGRQIIRVFTVFDYGSSKHYEQSLYGDEEASNYPCTERNVSYVANIVSGVIARNIRNYLSGIPVEKEIGIDVEYMHVYTVK